MTASALFRPFSCKSLNLTNRIVMAPMTRSFAPGGVVTEEVANYYARRASGGGRADPLRRHRNQAQRRPQRSRRAPVPRRS